jgi:hypothetical protein
MAQRGIWLAAAAALAAGVMITPPGGWSTTAAVPAVAVSNAPVPSTPTAPALPIDPPARPAAPGPTGEVGTLLPVPEPSSTPTRSTPPVKEPDKGKSSGGKSSGGGNGGSNGSGASGGSSGSGSSGSSHGITAATRRTIIGKVASTVRTCATEIVSDTRAELVKTYNGLVGKADAARSDWEDAQAAANRVGNQLANSSPKDPALVAQYAQLKAAARKAYSHYQHLAGAASRYRAGSAKKLRAAWSHAVPRCAGAGRAAGQSLAARILGGSVRGKQQLAVRQAIEAGLAAARRGGSGW